MALGLQTDQMKIFHLFFAIVFHEALIAFSVGITMARQQLTLQQGVKYILIFSLAVPLGIFLGLVVQQAPGTGGSVASAIFQSLAAGIFIHVTFLELIPAELASSKDRMVKVAFHFLGFIAMALVTITMGSHH
jgi:zinc transporter 1/2/3